MTDTFSIEPSESLRLFVATGEPAKARAALRAELNDNRAGRQTLLGALAYAQERVVGLCEPYAVKPFADAIDPDRLHWTEAYHDAQVTFLKANFAAERYAHLVDVRLHLRASGVPGFVPIDTSEAPVGSSRAPRRVLWLLLAVAACGGIALIVAALGLLGKTR